MKDKILFCAVALIHTVILFVYAMLTGEFEITFSFFAYSYIAMIFIAFLALPITAIEMFFLELFYDFFMKKKQIF